MNENESRTFQNIWEAAKPVLRGQITVIAKIRSEVTQRPNKQHIEETNKTKGGVFEKMTKVTETSPNQPKGREGGHKLITLRTHMSVAQIPVKSKYL